MNRWFRLSLALLALLAICAGASFAQSSQESLGDYARAVKKTRPAPKPQERTIYDNDNLPSTSSISVVGNASQPSSQDASANEPSKTGTAANRAPASDDKIAKDEKKEPEIKAGQSASEREQALNSWKQKLEGQSQKISGLQHELELLQREYRVKSAEFYADTASRAQNPTGFAKDDADYKQKIADKQKELEAAKAKLSEMQDDARKAGAPASVADGQ